MRQAGRAAGFSFVELMAVLGLILIITLAAVAVYSRFALNGRRSDGVNALLAVSLAEERYRSSNTLYGTLAEVWPTTTSTEGYYALSVSGVSGTAYTISAAAVGGQAKDAENGVSCTTLQLSLSNGTLTKTPSACWPE